MTTAWKDWDVVRQPRSYNWAHAQCLSCARRWTWYRKQHRTDAPIYAMLCPACLGPLQRTRQAEGFRVIPYQMVAHYRKAHHGERP